MIVVVGGTGRVGRQVVTQLAESGRPVRSVSRGMNPAGLRPGAEAASADLADPASLEAHLQDAQSLFLVWPFTSVEVTAGLAPKVAEIAARHVTRVVYLSAQPAADRPDSFWALVERATRLAWLLADLPVEIMGRLRSDRVMYFPAPPRPARPAGTGGRPPRHGAALKLSDPQTWPVPAVTTGTQTTRYGTARAMAWASCTSNWPAAAAGRTTTARCRSSRAPSSGFRSITCPATAARNRYGCGPHAPTRPAPSWTAPGRCRGCPWWSPANRACSCTAWTTRQQVTSTAGLSGSLTNLSLSSRGSRSPPTRAS
jgi:hypothetical protein